MTVTVTATCTTPSSPTPFGKAASPVQEVIHGAAQITDIEDASSDPAAVE